MKNSRDECLHLKVNNSLQSCIHYLNVQQTCSDVCYFLWTCRVLHWLICQASRTINQDFLLDPTLYTFLLSSKLLMWSCGKGNVKWTTKLDVKNNNVVVEHSSRAFIGLDQSSPPQYLHDWGKGGMGWEVMKPKRSVCENVWDGRTAIVTRSHSVAR